MSHCPKCRKLLVDSTAAECPHCGIIFEKYREFVAQQNAQKQAQVSSMHSKNTAQTRINAPSFSYTKYIIMAVFFALAVAPLYWLSQSATDRVASLQQQHNNAQTRDAQYSNGSAAGVFDNAGSVATTQGGSMGNERAAFSGARESTNARQADLPMIIENAKASSVLITSDYGLGTGFFFNDSCYVVTNKHVIEPDKKVIARLENQLETMHSSKERTVAQMRKYQWDAKLYREMTEAIADVEGRIKDMKQRVPKSLRVTRYDGQEHTVWNMATSDAHDLAVLDISHSGCANFAGQTVSDVAVGETLYAVGNPSGLKFSVTSGIMSGLRQDEETGHMYIQTDTPINPGSSGGVLMNQAGAVVGINTFILRGTEGIGFAIPIDVALDEFDWYLR